MDEPGTTATRRNSRSALPLFAIYCVFYAGFIALSTFTPGIMAKRPFGGVNLAILYGFALIVLALVLACIYLWRCRDDQEAEQA